MHFLNHLSPKNYSVKTGNFNKKWLQHMLNTSYLIPQLIEVNGYEAWQNPLFNVFVRFFGHDRVQNTIGHD